MEMPLFTGSNPDTWIFCAELLFSVNKMMEVEKLMVAKRKF